MISRNHSNVSKSAFLISQVLYCSSIKKNNPSCFTVYYEIKLRRNLSCPVDYAAKFPGEFDEFLSFVDISKNNMITFEDTYVGENLYAGGGIGLVDGSFHKSLKTLFDWPEIFTLSCELLKLGCDWLSRSQTTAKTTDNRIYREASPRKSLRLFLLR